MAKKKADAQQKELFEKQARLKSERTTIYDEGNRLYSSH